MDKAANLSHYAHLVIIVNMAGEKIDLVMIMRAHRRLHPKHIRLNA